jgi:hypothetical protein
LDKTTEEHKLLVLDVDFGTPWMSISSPAGNGYSSAGYISFVGTDGPRYAPNYLNDTSRATRTITAVNPGTTTIQVNVPGNPGPGTGPNVGTLVVNVQTRVTGISIAPTDANLTMQGLHRPSQQFTSTLTPSNANSGTNVTWTSSNPAVATVNSNGLVTPVRTRTYIYNSYKWKRNNIYSKKGKCYISCYRPNNVQR